MSDQSDNSQNSLSEMKQHWTENLVQGFGDPDNTIDLQETEHNTPPETKQHWTENLSQGFDDTENITVDLRKVPCEDKEEEERQERMDSEKQQPTEDLTARGTVRKIRLHDDMPRPDLPAWHDKNLVRKEMKVRLDKEVIKSITAFAKAAGKPRQECVQEAIVQYLARSEIKHSM